VLVLNPPKRMVLVLVIERASSSTSTKKSKKTGIGVTSDSLEGYPTTAGLSEPEA
jgi:hypothetical protein